MTRTVTMSKVVAPKVVASCAAGRNVLPGGRGDDADHADELEAFCSGLDDDDASDQLGIESGGLAYWVAAIRECFEEAGILLASSASGAELDIAEGERHDVHDGSLSMLELCRRHDLVLDCSTTQYVDHWITPKGERRRFAADDQERDLAVGVHHRSRCGGGR